MLIIGRIWGMKNMEKLDNAFLLYTIVKHKWESD